MGIETVSAMYFCLKEIVTEKPYCPPTTTETNRTISVEGTTNLRIRQE